MIQRQLSADLDGWYSKFGKPMIVSEYGADTVEGMHHEPPLMFTEEFQVAFIRQYHATFDTYRKEFLVGELIWNMHDFATDQSDTRVGGRNRKGVLTRERKPKMAAHELRRRYMILDGTVSEGANDRNDRSASHRGGASRVDIV